MKAIKWWLLSDEKAREIRLCLIDCINVTGNFSSSRVKNAMNILDSAVTSTKEVPNDFGIDLGEKLDRGVLEGYTNKEAIANFNVTFVMMRSFILGVTAETTLTPSQRISLTESALDAFEKSFDLIKE